LIDSTSRTSSTAPALPASSSKAKPMTDDPMRMKPSPNLDSTCDRASSRPFFGYDRTP